jgi:sulfoxide reductase catalytic subunit YedY
MLVRIRRGWELPESAATPEAVFHDRRRLAKALVAGPILAAATPLLGAAVVQAATEHPDPSAGLYPVDRNPDYTLGDRPLTAEQDALSYNNYYEFGSHKQIARAAQALPIRPWTVKFDGMVEQEREVDFDRRCRSRNGSTAIAASKHGRWRYRGRASRCAISSNMRSRWRRRNTSSCRRSARTRA